ncbi:MAG: VWA domain-containing protein [Bdellovibrionales bacterium]|nr:VWA domain-containing protein [Bdellovibrionales bacterium]
MKLKALVFILVSLLYASPSWAKTGSVVFILDGSNSMWQRMDGREKILVAREVIGKAIAELPSEQFVGLAAYGHRRESDCNDIEMLLPVGKHSKLEFEKALNSVVPHGKTPITASMKFVAQKAKQANAPLHLVLVSDGKETCEGDPCAAAASLREAGAEVRVHVVGFDVRPDERKQLQCIASAGAGTYFDARSSGELTSALGKIQETVKAEVEKKSNATQLEAPLVPSWEAHINSQVYKGTRSVFLAASGKPLIQLVSENAENIALTIDGPLKGKQTVSSASFVSGRGAMCRKVGKENSFEIELNSSREGWLSGTFKGKLGCSDHTLLQVTGSFLLKADNTLKEHFK